MSITGVLNEKKQLSILGLVQNGIISGGGRRSIKSVLREAEILLESRICF